VLDILDLFNATTVEAQAALLAAPAKAAEPVRAGLRQSRLNGRARRTTEGAR
jgi:hypothetical protein